MVALQVEEIKIFTQKLFLGEDFDDFLLKEAQITTFNRFTIDGHIRKNFYTEKEFEQLPSGDFSYWKSIRPICFSLIRGKRLPENFYINLQADSQQVKNFLQNKDISSIQEEQINGLYLHIRYEEEKLCCVTGTSLSVFTLNKSLEREWDKWVKEFLKEKEIAANEC